MSTPNYEYYGMMAEFWDLFRGDTSTWDDRFFYLDVVKKYGQPVLDVGCGTGRILLDFMSQGIDIDGVDNSLDMLALLKQKTEKLNLHPIVYQQEMTALSLPRRYQTILVPSSSFQLLLDPVSPPLAMRCFYEHLLPGGNLTMPFMTLWREGDPLESESTREVIRPAWNIPSIAMRSSRMARCSSPKNIVNHRQQDPTRKQKRLPSLNRQASMIFKF